MTAKFRRITVEVISFCLLCACNVTPNINGVNQVLSPTVATFTQVQAQVFGPYCISCHADSFPRGQTSLQSYASAMLSAGAVVPFQPYQSKVYELTSTGQMPPRNGGSPLSPSQLQLIYYWIAYGAQNN